MEQIVKSLTIVQLKKLDVYADIPRYERKSTANKLTLVSLIIKYYDPTKHQQIDDRPKSILSPKRIPSPKRVLSPILSSKRILSPKRVSFSPVLEESPETLVVKPEESKRFDKPKDISIHPITQLRTTKMYNYLFSLLTNPIPDIFNDPSVGSTLIKYIKEGEDPFANLNISPNITFNIPITIFSIISSGNVLMIYQYLKSINYPIPDNFFISDKYALGEILGEGAYGAVYLGQNNKTGALVAIKKMSIPFTYLLDLEFLNEFSRELLALQSVALNCTYYNISCLHDAYFEQQYLFLVMTYVEGPTLDNFPFEGRQLFKNIPSHRKTRVTNIPYDIIEHIIDSLF